jgi:hypothetical protein
MRKKNTAQTFLQRIYVDGKKACRKVLALADLGKMQMEITIKCHCALPSAGEDEEQLSLLSCLWECQMCNHFGKTVRWSPKMPNICLPQNLRFHP